MGQSRTEQLEDADVALAAEALGVIVRYVQLPRERQLLIDRAGVAIDWAAYPVLRRIELHAPVRLSDLAHVLGIDLSTVSRQVKNLEGLGLVKRDADPRDGRASTLRLTASGRRALDRLHAARRSRMAELLTEWSAEDRGDLALLLTKLADQLQSQGERS